MDKKVSIIVPIYNGEKYIDNCIKNLQNQTYSNLEFILVDDGSKDGTAKLCDYYAKKDERIKVIHQHNGGLSAARNSGTQEVSGDYLVYVDVDDDIIPTLVEDNVKLAIENDADVVFYNFWYHNLDTNTRIKNKYQDTFIGNNAEFFKKKLNATIDFEIFNAPWNKLYKVEFLRMNKLEFLTEFPIYEDIIFASRMIKVANRIVINPNRYYVYYLRSSGSLLTKFVDGYFDSVTEYYLNAMKYCDLYSENAIQRQRFTNLYIRLVTTNLKQISCRKQLSIKDRLHRISKICHDANFREALCSQGIEKRKQVIKLLVMTGNKLGIFIMYNILAKNREVSI